MLLKVNYEVKRRNAERKERFVFQAFLAIFVEREQNQKRYTFCMAQH